MAEKNKSKLVVRKNKFSFKHPWFLYHVIENKFECKTINDGVSAQLIRDDIRLKVKVTESNIEISDGTDIYKPNMDIDHMEFVLRTILWKKGVIPEQPVFTQKTYTAQQMIEILEKVPGVKHNQIISFIKKFYSLFEKKTNLN